MIIAITIYHCDYIVVIILFGSQKVVTSLVDIVCLTVVGNHVCRYRILLCFPSFSTYTTIFCEKYENETRRNREFRKVLI